ncbi:hypothetical protein EDB80DRAFT_676395 [Ilyonectria destructans]|nr:hypothetical protein EDB80DRAFT_676395 [Ilyonectria destructans]
MLNAAVCCGMQSRERREQDGVAPPVGDGRGGGSQQQTASSRQGRSGGENKRRQEKAGRQQGHGLERGSTGAPGLGGGEGKVLSVRCVRPRGYQQTGSLQGKNPRRPGVGSVDWRKGGRDHWDCGGERRKQWKGRGRERRQPRGVVAESEEHEHGGVACVWAPVPIAEGGGAGDNKLGGWTQAAPHIRGSSRPWGQTQPWHKGMNGAFPMVSSTPPHDGQRCVARWRSRVCAGKLSRKLAHHRLARLTRLWRDGRGGGRDTDGW